MSTENEASTLIECCRCRLTDAVYHADDDHCIDALRGALHLESNASKRYKRRALAAEARERARFASDAVEEAEAFERFDVGPFGGSP